MNAQEQLSALLDGELPEAEVPMAVRRLARDPALRDATLRYSLIGDALRGELPAGRPAGLVERVRAEIDAGVSSEPVRRSGNAGRLAAGFAVAASVALVALVALPGGQEELPPPNFSATEVASPAPEQRTMIQPVYTRAAGGGPDRLTRYYVNHSEYAPAMSGRGTLTRIIVIQPESALGQEPEPDREAVPAEEGGKPQ
ncbi:sigma-E factor negative regulatory protein [Thioalkalivibrio sp. XN279]|uniref:sigma-E factor negative regulatory protein n=1 Tax=Thioalkalivibrio sp. XN279 TaxID=2714953 RepID=UPI00140ABD5E|nr:sigma-E factor negative regulatory protein [Thioalkalivibrio sp. XN279]NHA15259.1 sigma-E factor negative regulatory protein [Thioalkalivibrio sp. XN279]